MKRKISRRSFLKVTAAMGAATAMSACGGSVSSTVASNSPVAFSQEAASTVVEEAKPCNLTVIGADGPMTQFARDEILSAAQQVGVEDAWTVSFDGTDDSIAEQGYTVTVSGNTISVKGGDDRGLMYGGLEVAEQLAISNGIDKVKNTTGAPDILNRGIKFNAPLDMRTPSYTDAGEAAQLNIENMWDMDFWKEYFDELARNRFNVFSLWNLNPFPSMVKVEDYPDVALDDVWRTTIPFDDSYNGTATNMVRDEHWENYEIVLEMNMDEKINFWKEVMAYAHSRGIKFYIITWNIYTYGEHGKYGITSDINNEITVDYYRKSVKSMIETYPDLDGIGAAAGENMQWEPGMEVSNEEWLWKTYGRGINDALTTNPSRDFTFIHRLHLTEFELAIQIWADFKGTLDFSDKYSIAHMHSSTHPTFTDNTFKLLPANNHVWLEVRGDDMYYTRWADADFVRDYFAGMPGPDKLCGFVYGTDGYIMAKDYLSTKPDEDGMLYIQKHWLEMILLGQLSYNFNLTNEHFEALTQKHFEGIVSSEKASQLYKLMNLAGKIIPQFQRMIWFDGDNFLPEMNLTNKTSFGFYNVKYWTNSSKSMNDAGVMSIPDYIDALKNGQTTFDLQTPDQVADNLEQWACDALTIVDQLLIDEPMTYVSKTENEFYSMVKDQQMQATMGLYYSTKTRASVELGLYNNTSDEIHQDAAITYLETALEYWREYATLFDARFEPQLMGRLQFSPNPTALIADVEEDISYAQNWRIKNRASNS